ncbi:hypothetical protein FOVG_16649 [Fusarium oxysporum f. sp. pisi HDV247]|uniref:Amine oxidase domain-containing protein n=1 Tax=Fusarium oxysporum f. sp. pisi HDV247 TaxID=1080344 RepID=W9NH32_FUSOX|nr:hypothetical protein FOVG_16649 [Fusarium oxysporum f. sp. pisi HDV247]
MLVKIPSLLMAAGIVALPSTIAATHTTHTTSKDVVIIGGGAAGTYAAVRLREDYGQSIALIEKEGLLGGAVNTWTDPKTGTPYELGVEAFLDYSKAREFFARFNVSVNPSTQESVITRYADFCTGRWANYTAPTATEQFTAFEKYVKLAEQYEDMMLPGLWNFPSPGNIPEDLLLSFGDFAKKHGIEAAVPTIWDIAAVGLGDLKTQPTFYVIQTFPAPLARVFIGKGQTLYVASHRNQDIYDRVSELLGDDVLYSSVVVSAQRTSNGVKVVAKHKDGHLTEIRARRLLIAIPPTVTNLAPFQLDKHEFDVLSKAKHTTAYAGGVVSSNLPLNTSIVNTAPSGDWLDYPDLSFLQWFKNLDSPDSYHKVMMFGDETLDSKGAKAVVEQSYKRLVQAGSLPGEGGTRLEWLDFAEHGSVNLRTSVEELKAGYIQELYSLQGHLSTWYTGAAWSSQLHTPTWAFSDTVVPRLVESLK